MRKVKLEETKNTRRLHIGSYFTDLNESDYQELVKIFSEESNKELLSKIEDLKLTIEALEDHVRDKTIERDKAQQMNEGLLEALQNYDGVFNSPISRRKIDSDMANECRKFGRETLALLQSTTQEKGEIKGRCGDPMVCLRGCSVKDGTCVNFIPDEKK